MLKIDFKEPLPIVVNMTEVFTALPNETVTDLTDAMLVIEASGTPANIITKTLSNGITQNTVDPNILDVQLDVNTDFTTGKLEEGKTYRVFFYFKTTNITEYKRVKLNHPTLKVLRSGKDD